MDTSDCAPHPALAPKRVHSPSTEDTTKMPRTCSSSSISSMASAHSGAEEMPPPPPEPACPPLVLDTPKGWPHHAITLAQLTSKSFTATCSGPTLRITAHSVSSFRVIQRYLTENKLPFHTFSIKGERLLKVVIRGLPPTLTPTEVSEALLDEGFDVQDVKIMKKDGGYLTDLWLLSLRDKEGNPANNIYTIKSLFYCKVHVTKYNRPTGPSQCHRCQGFGHGSSMCGRAPRCVKCSGAHLRDECPKEMHDAPTCCHCGGSHTANYRGCVVFKAQKARAFAARENSRHRPATRPQQAPRTPATSAGTLLAERSSHSQPPLSNAEVGPRGPAEASFAADHHQDSTQDQDQGEVETFADVARRRRRQPRNPANRHLPAQPQPASRRLPDQPAARRLPARPAANLPPRSRQAAHPPACQPEPATSYIQPSSAALIAEANQLLARRQPAFNPGPASLPQRAPRVRQNFWLPSSANKTPQPAQQTFRQDQEGLFKGHAMSADETSQDSSASLPAIQQKSAGSASSCLPPDGLFKGHRVSPPVQQPFDPNTIIGQVIDQLANICQLLQTLAAMILPRNGQN